MRFCLVILLHCIAFGPIQKPNGNGETDKAAIKNQPAQTITFVDNRAPQAEGRGTRQNSPNWLATSAPAEWALFVAGGVGVIIALRTLKAINRQVGEMAQQREVMFGQMRAMHEQVTQMSAQTAILDKSVAVAKESADAAKVSADIAAGVAIPTVKVDKFELGNMGNANIMAILQFPKLNIVIRNHGQSPAFLHSWSVVLTCEDLPLVPDYFGHPGSGNLLDKIVVQSNEPYTMPELSYLRRQGFSFDDVQAILDRTKMLSVYGYVCYGDIFGNPLKRLKFGEFALNIGENYIEWCDMADPIYCGADLYPIKGKGTKVEAEPVDEEAN